MEQEAEVITLDVTPHWPTLIRFFGADCERCLHGKTQKVVGVAIMPADGGIRAYVRSGGQRPKFAVYTKHEGRWMKMWSQPGWTETRRTAFIWGETDFDSTRMEMWEYADVSFGGPGVKA